MRGFCRSSRSGCRGSGLVEEKLLISNLEKSDVEDGAFEQATVELAHESLISAWPTLALWLKEARQVLFIRGRLSHDAAEWQRLRQRNPDDSGHADEELWSGTRLSTALELRARGDFRTVLGGLSVRHRGTGSRLSSRKPIGRWLTGCRAS